MKAFAVTLRFDKNDLQDCMKVWKFLVTLRIWWSFENQTFDSRFSYSISAWLTVKQISDFGLNPRDVSTLVYFCSKSLPNIEKCIKVCSFENYSYALSGMTKFQGKFGPPKFYPPKFYRRLCEFIFIDRKQIRSDQTND